MVAWAPNSNAHQLKFVADTLVLLELGCHRHGNFGFVEYLRYSYFIVPAHSMHGDEEAAARVAALDYALCQIAAPFVQDEPLTVVIEGKAFEQSVQVGCFELRIAIEIAERVTLSGDSLHRVLVAQPAGPSSLVSLVTSKHAIHTPIF